MGNLAVGEHMDISNAVDVSDTAAVAVAVTELLAAAYPGFDAGSARRLFEDFDNLYSGRYPGYRACDVLYHNERHVLDVTLAMARLLDGVARAQETGAHMDAEYALLGVITALFHDAGYIRREEEPFEISGATFTRIHVTRGERFLGHYLPKIGLGRFAEPAGRVIHFTGYEIEPRAIPVAGEQEFLLGCLLGTADLIAQMSDRDYVRKCCEDLFQEFVAGGLASAEEGESRPGVLYHSAHHLLEMTPQFMAKAVQERLENQFHGVHRFAAAHFGGNNLYMDAIEDNRRCLEAQLAQVGA
ncbi:MAG: hypothetical protein HKN19_00330 [Halioglobus sp.]|nr:hypothetical protein [Halioglobus sp.]